MYMDDIRLFAKNEKELETLLQTMRIYNQDIGMEISIEKSAMLEKKSGKRHITEVVELPNQVDIRTLGEKETYKYLRILEADTIKQLEMKDKIKKEYLRMLYFGLWPGQKCHSRRCTGRKWHIPMAIRRGNRVGGNWLTKWDKLKNHMILS